MKKKQVNIVLKGKVVSTIEVPTYETLDEMVSALGHTTVLSLANRQNIKNIKSRERAKHVPRPLSKKALRDAALQLALSDPSLKQKLMQVIGDMDKLMSFLDSLSSRVKDKA